MWGRSDSNRHELKLEGLKGPCVYRFHHRPTLIPTFLYYINVNVKFHITRFPLLNSTGVAWGLKNHNICSF